jgi:hypothetical protein
MMRQLDSIDIYFGSVQKKSAYPKLVENKRRWVGSSSNSLISSYTS